MFRGDAATRECPMHSERSVHDASRVDEGIHIAWNRWDGSNCGEEIVTAPTVGSCVPVSIPELLHP